MLMKKEKAAQILRELATKQTGWVNAFGQEYSRDVIEALNLGEAALKESKMKIKVLVKLPKCPPHIEFVDNTLEGLQNLVRGNIETIMLEPGWCVICDEEGIMKGRFKNCKIGGVDFVGKIAFAGVNGEEFADFELTEEFRDKYWYLWEE